MTDNGRSGISGPNGSGSRGWATGTRFGDRYLVGRLIGEGGWAETYEGQDLLLGRTVALKVLRTQFAADPTLVDRFEREARISAAVSHPNVVAVYDYGTQDGSFFIALQFIAGEDLKQLIVRQGRVAILEAIHITREILRGLEEIHRAGIVHRDVKPQNVLMGRDGLIRITDFGIAHQELATRVTTHGDAIGTASYMAPEQAQGEDVSPATDIYAVGVVLYELLTGRLPFNRGHAMAILLAHIQEQPLPPSAVAADAGISPWLDRVVLRAMEKQPGDRFPSAAAMIDALTGMPRESDITAPMGTAVAGTVTTIASPGMPTRQGDTIVSSPVGGARVRGSGAAPPHRPPPPSQASGDRPRPSRWGRWIALAFALGAILAVVTVVASVLLDGDPLGLWGENDDPEPTATARVVSPLPTATEVGPDAGDGEETPERPLPTETEEPEDEATETPVPVIVPRPTTELPQTPTEEPDVPPTETPDPTDTPEPPTETPVPVEEEPTDVPEVPTEPVAEDSGPPSGSGSGPDAAEILIPANQWTGGAGTQFDEQKEGDNGQPREVTEIDTSSDDDAVATAVFGLVTVPADGVMIEIEVRLEDADSGPGELSVAVNDAEMRQPIDLTAGGGRWSIVEVPVPAGALTEGNNQIVATASDPSGNADGRATILLGDITITPAGAVVEPSVGADGETVSIDDIGPGAAIVDDDSQSTDVGPQAPTITPR